MKMELITRNHVEQFDPRSFALTIARSMHIYLSKALAYELDVPNNRVYFHLDGKKLCISATTNKDGFNILDSNGAFRLGNSRSVVQFLIDKGIPKGIRITFLKNEDGVMEEVSRKETIHRNSYLKNKPK